MNFNFDDVKTVSNAQLPGNAIHDVTFEGCEARDFAGKQEGNNFKVLEIKFRNNDGVFTHTVWEPRQEDFQDRTSPQGYTQPSNVKVMMYLFKHLINAVNPDLGKKLDKGEVSLNASSWDALRKLVVESTDPGKGVETKIKLIKNNKGEGIFPYFLNYNKENKLYMSTNFIGNNIFWTTKELDRIKKSEVKPTEVKSDEFGLPIEDKKDEDFDINI